MKKKHLLGLAATTLIVLAGCSSQEIATSKYGNVTKEELYDSMKQSAGKNALLTLLLEKTALANVKDKDAVEKQVNEFMTAREASSGGAEAFEKLIKENGIASVEAYRKSVYNEAVIGQVIKENITVTDAELLTAYETYVPKMTASHILVADENVAKDIINQLNNGGDWNALVTEHSTDEASKVKNGSLGEFSPSQMIAEFSNAAKALKNGEISQEPVKTTYGFHIIKMENNPEKKSYDEEKETIRQELIATKLADQTVRQEILIKLLQGADIKVSDTQLNQAISNILNPQTTTGN